ncbi:unnamed protein product, partial [Vitis vinifera]
MLMSTLLGKSNEISLKKIQKENALRFHVLQEFDEGKRSCQRRLAGHNKRRKTHPDVADNGNSLNDDQASGYLLISLLRILSNVHPNNKSDQTKDQDLLSHLLRSLARCSFHPNIG